MATTPTDRARVSLPADQEILFTREFGVPRDLVYRAWTTPDLVSRWWAGRQGRVTGIEIDLRVGGHWRYAMVDADGTESAFHGEYLEIVPGERIVHTEVFEDRPDVQAVTTVTFSENAGRTTVSVLIRYSDRHERDAHYGYMKQGLDEGLDLLEETVLSLVPGHTPRKES